MSDPIVGLAEALLVSTHTHVHTVHPHIVMYMYAYTHMHTHSRWTHIHVHVHVCTLSYPHAHTHSAVFFLSFQGHDSTSILHFFRVLALCHTVIPEWNEDTNEVIFRASSPGTAVYTYIYIVHVRVQYVSLYSIYTTLSVYMYYIDCMYSTCVILSR